MFYKIAIAVLTPIFKLLFRMKIVGKENIPEGAAVVCVNHTSMIDPIFVAVAFGIKEKFGFMSKKELFENPLLRWLLSSLGAFPVDRGAADIATIRSSISTLRDGKKLLIFPEGRRVKGGADNSNDVKNGVAMIALRAAAPMIPVYLSTKKRLFGRVYVVIGQPVIPEKREGTSAENYKRISTEVFDSILAMGEACK
ncbi:MAG: 1-acyl-sn-glycerol-3-phosphate acyltransferase [Clostridia bacterium]|nr:1-acyl-sn-glycerol-3-phosphate acyltransferase [Clostridia bacterium]